MSANPKSPSKATVDKPKRERKEQPAYSVAAENAVITVDVPTIDNLKRALGVAAGKSPRKLVKLNSQITAVRMLADGKLQIAVSLAAVPAAAPATNQAA